MQDADVSSALPLSPHQQAVTLRVLDEEGSRREHLVVYLSGAHAYGFPSPDSDLDLKSIHVAPTELLVGLSLPKLTADRAEIIDGVEIDYTSNELAPVLAGLLAGNGNFFERVLGRTVVVASPLLAELRALAPGLLSRRVHKHYRGFAANQTRALAREPTIKKLLYVLRTTLTGTHLLRTGLLETDLTRLIDAYALGEARALIEAKLAGEQTAAGSALLDAWQPRIAALFEALDDTLTRSPLPEEPSGEAALVSWLISVRRARFSAR